MHYICTLHYDALSLSLGFKRLGVNTVVVAQLVRALVCGTRGRGFESRLPPNKKSLNLIQGLFFIPQMKLASNLWYKKKDCGAVQGLYIGRFPLLGISAANHFSNLWYKKGLGCSPRTLHWQVPPLGISAANHFSNLWYKKRTGVQPKDFTLAGSPLGISAANHFSNWWYKKNPLPWQWVLTIYSLNYSLSAVIRTSRLATSQAV